MMKIAFLCGSLEPGLDGVGDYVRMLASEVIAQGHEAVIVALNDTRLVKEHCGTQKAGNVELMVLRIPSIFWEWKRFKSAKQWINSYNPDWISVQFVPYAFHSKGLPFFSTFYLRNLTKKTHVHLMFHELWVDRKDGGWKLLLTSVLQKTLIKKMLHLLKPSVIHTHLPIYYSRLQKLGYTPKLLPLFSNVSVIKKNKNIENNIFRIGFFSQVANYKSVASFLFCLGKQIVQRKMQLEVLLIGGDKTKMIQFGNTIEQIENYKNNVKHTGFLAPEELSEALQSCTLGLTPVPRHLLGKSGSVTAFLTHGIPVAAPNVREYHSASEIGFFVPGLCASIVQEPEVNQLKNSKEAVLKARKNITLNKITKTFLSDLENSINSLKIKVQLP